MTDPAELRYRSISSEEGWRLPMTRASATVTLTLSDDEVADLLRELEESDATELQQTIADQIDLYHAGSGDARTAT